jgi:hypothetical protein
MEPSCINLGLPRFASNRWRLQAEPALALTEPGQNCKGSSIAMQIGAGRSSFSRSIDEPGDYPQRKLLAVPTSRAANQYPSPEDQGASQRHLRCGRYDRCLHKTMSNPGNDSEFN